jgi:hypothetical protein
VIQKIIKPVITVEDFRSAVKCVPEKTALSYSGRGIPHYKAYAENMDDGLENFMKGRIVRQWETYIALHIRQKQIGLQEKEWAAKLIIALWDHLHRIWTFRNGVLHENNQGHIARYKVEALQRKIEVVWGRYNVQ